MKYLHLLNYVSSTPWAILPTKLSEMMAVLAMRANGESFTAEEIAARIGDARQPMSPAKGNVAVVPLFGVIAHRMGGMSESSGGASAERFAAIIHALAQDESVGTVLLDCNSPGGTIAGVQEAAQAVYDLAQTKRVVAIANSAMASAAYWICSQANEIVAIPSVFDPVVGSIGVFTVHKDLSGALDQAGIKVEFISAGKYKVDGNEFGPLSEESRGAMQAMVDAAYARFTADVARGRKVSASDVRSGFGEGRGLSAKDAKAAGLIDRIATFDDTLARLCGTRGQVAMGAGMSAGTISDELVRDGSVNVETAVAAEFPSADELERAALDTQQAAEVAADQEVALLAAIIGRE